MSAGPSVYTCFIIWSRAECAHFVDCMAYRCSVMDNEQDCNLGMLSSHTTNNFSWCKVAVVCAYIGVGPAGTEQVSYAVNAGCQTVELPYLCFAHATSFIERKVSHARSTKYRTRSGYPSRDLYASDNIGGIII